MTAAQDEFKQYISRQEIGGGLTLPKGASTDIHDAYGNMFFAEKQMGALLDQVGTYSPEGIKDLRRTVEGTVGADYANTVGTLNPQRAVTDAVTSIAGERPDDYTTYLASDAGLQDLLQRAQISLLAPPYEPGNAIPVSGFGAPLSDAIRKNLPAGALTDILANTVDLMGDPAFLATLPFFPGATLARKALTMAEVSGFLSAGAEAEERGWAPPYVGSIGAAIAGPLLLHSLPGLARAGVRFALERAAADPIAGTPATELLRQKGYIITGTDELRAGLGIRKTPTSLADIPAVARADVEAGPDIIYSAQYPERAEAIIAGSRTKEVWATRSIDTVANPGTEDSTILTLRVREGAKPVRERPDIRGGTVAYRPEDVTVLAQTPITQVYDAETIALAKPISRTLEADLAEAQALSEKALPAMAGGADMLTPELQERIAYALLERPEANDALRKFARVFAKWVPGGEFLVQRVDQLALMDDPAMGGVARWVFNKGWQDARRVELLAPFNESRVPFLENGVGQMWVPAAAGSREGAWIAGGDVIESIMRGESTYVSRFTPEQVGWLRRLYATTVGPTAEASAATGIKIAIMDVHWPRFVVTARGVSVQSGAGGGKPAALFRRVIEEQQQAIEELGIRYRPGLINQADLYIQGMDRIARNSLVNAFWKEKGVIRIGRPKATEQSVAGLGFGFRGVMPKEQLRQVATFLGPGARSRSPAITIPQKVNAVMRMLLTGTADTGWGAIQLQTLPWVADNPAAGARLWARAMAEGFRDMATPRALYRFIQSPAARDFAAHGGNMQLESEFLEATRLLGGGPGPTGKILGATTLPFRVARGGVQRLTRGFEGSLLFGRIMAYDAMVDAAKAPGRLLRMMGAPKGLTGEALEYEKFRIARFADTLIGQPQLSGVLSPRQMQIESAWVWFATRYTRSFLGTLSYVAGSGYTPAAARLIMAKMLLGGAAITSGLITARGTIQGRSQEAILDEIATALNPMSGKKFMAMEIAGGWYGLGGTYRSGFAISAGLADKDNWNYDNWEAFVWNNPVVRGWRTKGAPSSTKFADFMYGSDYIGQEVDIAAFVDDPRKLLNYFTDNYTPITVNAYLQGQGDWRVRAPRAVAEFFGLRTSPETGGEAQTAIRNKISNQMYGMDYDKLTNNRVARQRVNDSPEVVAVLEGYVRPMQQYRPESSWDKYLKQAEGVRANYGTQKEGLDTSARAGKLAGDDYRARYSDLQRQEFGELTGLQTALGLAFEDKEAPPDSVDGALNAYFAVDLNAYTDPATQETDWEGFYADREATLTGLSETDRADVDWYLSRHESELHRDFGKAFDEIIKPSGYLNARETVAKALGVDLPTLQKAAQQALLDAGTRAGGADVWLVVDEVLNQGLVAKLGEDAPTLSDLRNALREASPRLDVELYRQGYSDKVRTQAAIQLANDLKAQYPDRAYFTPPVIQDAE